MNTQQLEARSELERNAVENTVGELRRRLTPGQLVDELLAYTNEGGGEFISNLGRQATSNPLPVTLIGAGLAWFLFSKGGSNAPAPRASNTYGSAVPAGAETSRSPETDTLAAVKDAGAGAINSMRDGVAAVREDISQGLDSATATLSSTATSLTDSIARGASSVSETAQAAGRNASSLTSSAVEFLKDQPLVLLGAGLVVGAALGAGLPATEVENKLMGDASEQVKKQAKEAASDQLAKAKVAGGDLYEDIKQEVRDGISDLAAKQDGQMAQGYGRLPS
ncbi:MAG: hypothetical protein H7X89_05240 [Rhizobiales bacterium]|nr:hypothetical protein [Hyphomicrobiales bacterium]